MIREIYPGVTTSFCGYEVLLDNPIIQEKSSHKTPTPLLLLHIYQEANLDDEVCQLTGGIRRQSYQNTFPGVDNRRSRWK